MKSVLLSSTMFVSLSASILATPASAEGVAKSGSWVSEVIVTGHRETFSAPVTATATRTQTPIEEVPQSVQSLTRTFIEEQDLQTVSAAIPDQC